MKYLLQYKMFESTEDEMIEEIKYRLLELEDDGYVVKVYNNKGDLDHYRIGTAYYIIITNKVNFSLEHLKRYLEHLKSYMNESGYKCVTDSVESSEELPFKSHVRLKFIKD